MVADEIRSRTTAAVSDLVTCLAGKLESQLVDLYGEALGDLEHSNESLRRRLLSERHHVELLQKQIPVSPRPADIEIEANLVPYESHHKAPLPCQDSCCASHSCWKDTPSNAVALAIVSSGRATPDVSGATSPHSSPVKQRGRTREIVNPTSNAAKDLEAADNGVKAHHAPSPFEGMDMELSDSDDEAKRKKRWSMGSLTLAAVQPGSYVPVNKLDAIVRSKQFETFFNVVIVLNCVTMGIEAHGYSTGSFGPSFTEFMDVSEHVFTALFTIELTMRLKVFGFRSFWPDTPDNRWNSLDAFLVLFLGVLFTWIVPAISAAIGFSSESGIIKTLTVLRAFRLMRLVRVVSRVPIFREAWMLIRGLSDSFRTLFWTCVVIFFVTYLFAIFGSVLISKTIQEIYDGSADGAVKDKLGSIVAIIVGMDKLMFTLIQVLLGDSFHSFMRDIMEFIPWSWLYFYGYIAVAYLVLMNLVTAIIVDNAVTNSRSDEDAALKQKESHRAKELKEMKKLFLLMDADGNGTISWDEFKGSFADATLMKKWKLLDFQPEECKEIFALLDDGDGEIETGEFFEGLARMRGSASSKDVFRLQKMLNRIGERLDAISSPKRRPSKTPSNMSETPCRLPSKRSSNN
eukprot:TRINITY_DN7288_c0_g1_i3.p1 TRINITY_DN7288_c0_g1~~TRINITY_DN7288_c0_g1_i3.p1  ORF type:complete len:684 (+),score=116.16 TRINITY_DN7288_c0_g1_i3:163-2052(+)